VEPNHYVASLETVGELPAQSGYLILPEARSEMGVPEGLRVRRSCYLASPSCMVLVDANGVEQPAAASFDVSSSRALTLRHDPNHGFFVLEEEGRRHRALTEKGRPTDIALRSIADRLAPPRSFTIVASIGIACSMVLLWFARRAGRLARALEAGLAGNLDREGWIHIEKDSPIHLPNDVVVREGPVVVLPIDASNARPHSAYRTDRTRRRASVIIGKRDELVAHFEDLARARYALSSAIVAITSAPLFAALLRGLVI
jgi:hypothetical protein